MKFTLRNLGRLREAAIDLDKDLILLTGPNNTSKTYVAHAIYGFAGACCHSSAEVSTLLSVLACSRPMASLRVGFQLAERIIPTAHQAHILTAERAAIQLFSRELSTRRTELVDGRTT